MPNRLADETSPYLLQHKDNPVDWYAWGPEAFAAAQGQDKPILLSVGYSACHWCHVMAHESFENAETAALMNERFINIKVDREERPDVDAIYMQAVQSFSGGGGWPMTVFLLPNGVPFFGGTYFPPEDFGGRPSFRRVLEGISTAYAERRDELLASGEELVEKMASVTKLAPSDALLSQEILDQAAQAILAHHDDEWGGFGEAPKFPQPMVLEFLMRTYQRTKQPELLAAIDKTLNAMACGGMYDQVGGGFHRYSTDTFWLLPHFEKMLYDNAQLARVYLDAFTLTGNQFHRRIVTETLDYVLREMTDPAGGFYSSQDADSEGEEGKFFLWTYDEFEELLEAQAGAAARFFDITTAGNFGSMDERNILYPRLSPEDTRDQNNLPASFPEMIAEIKQKLFEEREKRVHPGRDDKVLTDWNGLMLSAFAQAALHLNEPRYLDAATRNADFLLDQMRPGERLLHSWKRFSEGEGGIAKVDAFLEDYALLATGLLDVYSASFQPRYLSEAIALADQLLELFWDESSQGFYDTGIDQEALITRPRGLFDSATPSGTSAACRLLLRLASLTGKPEYERPALVCLRTLAPYLGRAPTSFANLLNAVDFYLARKQELALVYPADASSAHPEALESRAPVEVLLDVLRDRYLPDLLLVGGPEGAGAELTPLLQDRPSIDTKATAYLCEHFVCQAPTTEPDELKRQLGLS